MLTACTRFQNRSGEVEQIKTGSLEGTLTVSGVNRHYLLYFPTGYNISSPVALIINFHGLGADSLDEEGLSGMSGKAEKEGFIVVYPDGLNKAWDDGTGQGDKADLDFVSALIQTLEGKYSIDP